jgi:hypothetical protein
MIYWLFSLYMIYAIIHYIVIGQFNKHKPSLTIEEWHKKL